MLLADAFSIGGPRWTVVFGLSVRMPPHGEQFGDPRHFTNVMTPQGRGLSILVVDDHPFMRGGVSDYLRQAGHHVVEAGDEASALAYSRAVVFNVAVLDLVIPPDAEPGRMASAACGQRLARQLKQSNPVLGLVFLSSYLHFSDDIYALLREWQRGIAYKSKTSPPIDLIAAINTVLQGGVLVDPNVLSNPRPLIERLWTGLTPAETPWVKAALRVLVDDSGLTPKEHQVARLMAGARTRQSIAQTLGIERSTVETHVTRIYSKLGLSELRAQAPDLAPDILLTKVYTFYDLQP